MKTRFALLFIVSALVLLGPGSVWGLQATDRIAVMSGTVDIPSDAEIANDLVASGGSVTIRGSVGGDVLAAAGEIDLSGSTERDAVLVGGRVAVSGDVGDDLRAAGGEVVFSGSVASNASIAGGRSEVTQGAQVGGNMHLMGGAAEMNGSVTGNLLASGGEVTINGTVGGNARVNASQLILGPNALIEGDLSYRSPSPIQIMEGAQVVGQLTHEPVPERPWWLAFIFAALAWFVGFFALLVTGIVVIALSPWATQAAADRVFGSPWLSLLMGIVLLIIVPFVILLLLVTIIGIPLALILTAMFAIMIYLSRIFVALALGRLIFRSAGRPTVSPYLAFFVGLIILWLIFPIPILGWILHIVTVIWGLGAIATVRYHIMRDLRREGRL